MNSSLIKLLVYPLYRARIGLSWLQSARGRIIKSWLYESSTGIRAGLEPTSHGQSGLGVSSSDMKAGICDPLSCTLCNLFMSRHPAYHLWLTEICKSFAQGDLLDSERHVLSLMSVYSTWCYLLRLDWHLNIAPSMIYSAQGASNSDEHAALGVVGNHPLRTGWWYYKICTTGTLDCLISDSGMCSQRLMRFVEKVYLSARSDMTDVPPTWNRQS